MRLTPDRTAAAMVALIFHALLAIYLWRTLIAPQQPVAAGIRWVELAPIAPARAPIASKLVRATTMSDVLAWSMPRIDAPTPPETKAASSELEIDAPSADQLLKNVRITEPILSPAPSEAEIAAKRVVGPEPRLRVPGLATPAVDPYFRDPSRRRTDLVGDTADGFQRMIYTDEYGHQFRCSKPLGSPTDPAGMSTRRTCAFDSDGPSNTEEWFKKRGID